MSPRSLEIWSLHSCLDDIGHRNVKSTHYCMITLLCILSSLPITSTPVISYGRQWTSLEVCWASGSIGAELGVFYPSTLGVKLPRKSQYVQLTGAAMHCLYWEDTGNVCLWSWVLVSVSTQKLAWLSSLNMLVPVYCKDFSPTSQRSDRAAG